MRKFYTTISGDMWDLIAFKMLGSELHKTALIEANLRHKDVYIFPAGVALRLPEIAASVGVGLPPWKRNTPF
ncbi:MAG: tail protein X [Oscillospiraceae bacterium]|nr:tail protein X [Oscillospiraceae bacterium]